MVSVDQHALLATVWGGRMCGVDTVGVLQVQAPADSIGQAGLLAQTPELYRIDYLI